MHIAMAATGAEKFTTAEQQASYGIGLQIGAELLNGGGSFPGIDVAAINEGFKDAFTKSPMQLDVDTLQAAFDAVQAKQKEAAEAVMMKGIQFLMENDKRPEITTTESGLQYEVIEAGTGETPTDASTVKVHYEGKLIDGTVFDSSMARGQPTEFPVNRVIKGWTEALCLMQVGAKWKLYIPSDLAYGDKGVGNVIGPHQVLIFDVELLEITG
jgi:FKBP-type peptidyl-prolyl cis-trans isomerase FklB